MKPSKCIVTSSIFCRNYMGQRYALGIFGKPQEVHPWHKDGICWFEEDQGTSGFNFLPPGSHKMRRLTQLGNLLKLYCLNHFI